MPDTFRFTVAPKPVAEMIDALERGSATLDEYLGREIYVKTDPTYLTAQRKRMTETLRLHRQRVGDRPTVLLRAPGRLNAFLEYLDMCDGDHMSTTIDGDIPVAVSARDDGVLSVGNANPLFPDEHLVIREEFERFVSEEWPTDAKDMDDTWDSRSMLFPHCGRDQGDWLNYILSPYMRVLWGNRNLRLKGADITFGPATVPFRAGTSSSSVVVVLSFLALCATNPGRLPKWSVSDVCRLLGEAEWYVGTHGGANDQMTILLNPANSVSYNRHSQADLRSTSLPFLRGVHVVLANSLWEVNKSSGGNQSFNMRKGWMHLGDQVAGLIIAAAQEAIRSGAGVGEGWLSRLLQERFGFAAGGPTPLLEADPTLWEKIAANYRKFGSLHEDILGISKTVILEFISLLPVKVTPAEAGAILGKHPKAIERVYTKPRRDIGGYHIRTTARFFHRQNMIGKRLEGIFLEAEGRVASGSLSPESTEYDAYRVEVGRIVDDLQDALQFDFRVSTPQLDMLLSIAKRGPGYLGGKLTGAGKGGCVSLLVREAYSQAMCEYLDCEYYGKPERFEPYRQLLADDMRYSEPGSREHESAKERMAILDASLANISAQRRVITFSRGACAVEIGGR